MIYCSLHDTHADRREPHVLFGDGTYDHIVLQESLAYKPTQ